MEFFRESGRWEPIIGNLLNRTEENKSGKWSMGLRWRPLQLGDSRVID